ncbi:MAG TPA: GDSL-type esterase/lipase family protein [Chitinophaga sp.]|uniref:GDSL-type esterase/lipase family protein n=1 Tax=Chitinophaga sp. TaxID=1869181 RepID=UPI002BB4CEAE|nr:GDSL-type esterase/lipase family protein [Chitinophaga sp.]HVI48769.1 GDSL-type esterase/lipase family protein [Chitinophaga sp.]
MSRRIIDHGVIPVLFSCFFLLYTTDVSACAVTDTSVNTAIVPVSRLEYDNYDWWARHAEVLRIKDSINPEIVMIGNSITHFWGGYPLFRDAAGQLHKANGSRVWDSLYRSRRVLNLGFGWDRTQNVLWRIDHGELDHLHPRVVVIEIGTNNTSGTKNARANTAPEIVEGIQHIISRIHAKIPHVKIILMALLPRGQYAGEAPRQLINDTNVLLKDLAKKEHVHLINMDNDFLAPDGSLSKTLMYDFVHPTERGYEIWADRLRTAFREVVGKNFVR